MTLTTAIPVTVLTGFLGAGKTTLINHLLTHYPTEKIVVVENEFGAVGIDGGLLSQHTSVEVIELSNGCVCCSVRGELTEALQDLLSRRQRGELSFERLILETTGLADPAPVVQTFFVDENLRDSLRLDAVVALVDAQHAQQQLNEHRVAVAQVGFADRLIISKTDTISELDKQQLIDRLRKINARALCYQANHGAIDREAWLDIQAFNLDESFNVDSAFVKSAIPLTQKIPAANHAIIKSPELMVQSWNDDIYSHVFEAGVMDIKRIGAFMEQTIEQYGNDMLRYKGILAIANDQRRLIVQGVHRVVGFDYGSSWQNGETLHTKLVIIGRNLPIEQLRAQFLAAQAEINQ